MSTDNRSMLRKKGWFLCGKSPQFRSFFRRGVRLSVLCFLSITGIFEAYQTFGIDHCSLIVAEDYCILEKFIDFLVLVVSGFWMGHPFMDTEMINYMWGIVVIFLPSYCPFYNPIEIIFGQVKSAAVPCMTRVNRVLNSYCCCESLQSTLITMPLPLWDI
eukprot:Pompholyxophrys_sp_v1_NODE_140_length_1581_cov_8.710509.p2 type:complete len:160 gc:universal NODE_140_length_1581_cov_8.710509:742-1221(+)